MDALRPALQDSKGRSKPWGGSKLVNAFPEASEGDKAEMYAIMAVPGLERFAAIADFPVRGVHKVAEQLYAVVGAALYSVSDAGVSVNLGVIAGDGPVSMADNGAQLAIAGGNTGYVYSDSVLYTAITNLPPVSDVAYIDGYFVWTVAGSDQFIISGLDDGLTYDPLDVATVEGSPDPLVGVVNDHRELLFFGSETVEFWYNSGGADFPFERQGNAFVERGCVDKNSIVKIDNGVHFVTSDLTVERLQGYQPSRISTHAVEKDLAASEWFRGFTYTQEGHKFYVLNTDIACWCFDMATQAWAKRQSFGRENYRGGCSVQAYGKILIGDNVNGRLYAPDLDLDEEDGDPMPVIIELPPLEQGRERRNLYAFELYCETGVGTLATTDPQAILQYSRDGGRNWSNEMWRSMGAQGNYLTRAVWRVTVEFRQLQLRITMPEKVRRFVMGYFADIR